MQAITNEIQKKYETAKDVLLSRMLGEPYNFSQIAAMVNPGMFDGCAPAFAAMMEQYKKHGRYDTYSVAMASKMDVKQVLEIAKRHSDTDLPTAFHYFRHLHGQVTELEMHSTVLSCIGKDMEAAQIAGEIERKRKASGSIAVQENDDAFEMFQTELLGKIEGNTIDYPVKPSLAALRAHVPYWEPGEYVVIGGRTGMGKSYLAINEILYNAMHGVPCTYINLENTPKDVYWRFWQMLTEIDKRTDMSRMQTTEHQRMVERAQLLKSLPIKIYNTGRDIHTIISTMRNDRYERGTQLYGLDYIQLCSDRTLKGGRVDMLEEISASVRAVALELDTVVQAVAQINRGAETSADKRPKLSDLKGSGALEQDATTVMLIYRPGYYDIDFDENGTPYDPGYSEIEFAKGRNCGPGLVKARFDHIKGFYDTPAPEFHSLAPAPVSMNYSSVNGYRKEPSTEDTPF